MKLLRSLPWPPPQLSERWNREYSLRDDSVSLGELLMMDPIAQQYWRIQWNGDVTMTRPISQRNVDHPQVVVVERNASPLQFRPQMLGVLLRRYRHSRRHISSADVAIVLHFSSGKSKADHTSSTPAAKLSGKRPLTSGSIEIERLHATDYTNVPAHSEDLNASAADVSTPCRPASRCRAHVSRTLGADQRHWRQTCHPWWWTVEFRRIR